MKNILYILPIFIMSITFVGAQDEAIFNQYFINMPRINPATVGFDDVQKVNLDYRSAWASFPDRPKTFSFNYDGVLSKKAGIGLIIANDKVADLKEFKFGLQYAFKYKIKETKFSVGLSAAYKQMSIDDSVLTSEGIDPTDELLLDRIDGISLFDASVGVHGQYKDKTFFGLSVPNLIRTRLDQTTVEEDRELYYILYLGQNFDLKDYGVVLTPSFFLKKVRHAPFQLDANIKAGFADNRIITGLSLRVGNAPSGGLLLGTKLKQGLELFYSYDVSFQKFQAYNNGSHEIHIGYTFNNNNTNTNTTMTK